MAGRQRRPDKQAQKCLRKGGRKAARRPGTKQRNTGRKRKSFPWAAHEKAAKKPVPSAHSGQTTTSPGGSADQTQKRQCGPENNAAEGGHDCSKPCSREHTPGHRSHKPPQQRPAAQERPACHMARHAGKNPSEQAKFAFALLPARRGLVKRGRQKIASLFLAGTVFFASHCALRRTKGGAAPFYPLQAF